MIAGIIIGVILFILIIVAIVVGFSSNSSSSYNPRYDYDSDVHKELAGKEGERTVNRTLDLILKIDEHLLRNVLLPLKNGKTTEIDSIIITHKGIFCVETKNWVGHIYGSDDSEKWIQHYDNSFKEDAQRRNPVLQNQAHTEILERFLDYKYEIANVVIFPSDADLSQLNSIYTYTLTEFYQYYKNLDNDILTDEDINRAFNILKNYQASDSQIEKHKCDLKNKYN